MYKVIIWGMGKIYNQYINSLKLQEFLSNIEIVGITGRERLYDYLDGYRYIEPCEIGKLHIDYVIVATEGYYNEVIIEAEHMGFNRENIFPIRIFAIPCFDFVNYVKLVHSHISIFANDCWGGLTYHSLAMKFRTPLINMFETDEDYLKLVSNLKYYFSLKLEFDRWRYESNGDAYPVCRLDDILLYFNHYKSMTEIEEKWYSRVERINYNNLFIMMFTENRHSLEMFSNLPIKKKVCFVPFESTIECACTLKFANKKSNEPFWRLVNGIPRGIYNDYDVISLLNDGEGYNKRIIKPDF